MNEIRKRLIDLAFLVGAAAVGLGIWYVVAHIRTDLALHEAITRNINAERDAALKQLLDKATAEPK